MTIKQKQAILAFFDCYDGIIDGDWGPLSASGTTKLQRKLGIPDDGIFGPQTEEAARMAIGEGNDLKENSDEVISKTERPTGDFWEETPDFGRHEFECTCAGRGCNGFPAEPKERLVRNAQMVRSHFGQIVDVSSGVRCRLRNSELPGSADNSLHLDGRAMDFRVRGRGSSEVLAYIRTLPDVHEAYAIDEIYVHMGVQKY